jgi:hypothetical protein
MTLDLPLLHAGVFCLSLAVDYSYTRWTLCANQGKVLGAMFWTGALVLLGGMVTLSFLSNWTVIIPNLLGQLCGTYLAMRTRKPEGEEVAKLRRRVEQLETLLGLSDEQSAEVISRYTKKSRNPAYNSSCRNHPTIS